MVCIFHAADAPSTSTKQLFARSSEQTYCAGLLPSCEELVQPDLKGIARGKGSRFTALVTGVKGQNTKTLNGGRGGWGWGEKGLFL